MVFCRWTAALVAAAVTTAAVVSVPAFVAAAPAGGVAAAAGVPPPPRTPPATTTTTARAIPWTPPSRGGDAPPGRTARRKSRIRGGRAVTSLSDVSGAPFLVRLFSDNGATLRCTGSLLSDRHVLTAASCGVTAGSTARVGGLSLYGGYVLTVAAVTPFPWYDPAGRLGDLAVVTLADAPTAALWASRGVVPASLPPNGWVPPTLRVSGWGGNAANGSGTTWGGAVRTLHTGLMPVTPWEVCEAVLAGQTPLDVDGQVCANFESLEDTALCRLDTGGALWGRRAAAAGETTRSSVVYGVASYWALAEGNDDACPLAEPTLFTKVRAFNWWVEKVLGA
ncbi:hypothetical protein I4F81_005777 [Pyropia yezoensis]|uniref:Uncharacterized protein n=1 Tax=Pyropia yezoensis TaxID=2788 RepID=A0ACC3BZW1_PYRYE|nr:hypothetical protein I4F81_005777 [Neopyropia yezoensis]